MPHKLRYYKNDYNGERGCVKECARWFSQTRLRCQPSSASSFGIKIFKFCVSAVIWAVTLEFGGAKDWGRCLGTPLPGITGMLVAAELRGSWQTPMAEIRGRVFCWEQSSKERPGSYTFSLPESDLETSCHAASSGTYSPAPFPKQSPLAALGDESFGDALPARTLLRGRRGQPFPGGDAVGAGLPG